MIRHTLQRKKGLRIKVDFNLLPQITTGSTFLMDISGSSSQTHIVSFIVTDIFGSVSTLSATDNATTFSLKIMSDGTYTMSVKAVDSFGNISPILTKQITAKTDTYVPYIRHTLNVSSDLQNDASYPFMIFYGSGGPSLGSPNSFSIINLPAGITCTKYTNISQNEQLSLTVSATVVGNVTMTIRLTEGANIHDLYVSLSIINPFSIFGVNEWHFPTAGIKTFIPTVTGLYSLLTIGGGGGGGASAGASDAGHSSGGGGGAGFISYIPSMELTSGITYRIVIGVGGTGSVYTIGANGGVSYIENLYTGTTIISSQGGIGGGRPSANGSGSYGGNGSSGGGGGATSGETASTYGGNGGTYGSAGTSGISGSYSSGSGQGSSIFSTLSSVGISAGVGGRSLPPPGMSHPLFPSYPAYGIGEGGMGFGAGGGGGSGTCGSNNPGYGGGGAGGIYPSSITPPSLASNGERAPGVHKSSVGGTGASGYVRIKLL